MPANCRSTNTYAPSTSLVTFSKAPVTGGTASGEVTLGLALSRVSGGGAADGAGVASAVAGGAAAGGEGAAAASRDPRAGRGGASRVSHQPTPSATAPPSTRMGSTGTPPS